MKKLLFIGALCVLLGGCASPNSELGMALIRYTTEPITATNTEQSYKVGEACGVNILGILSFGDFSIDAAKYHGKISKVSSVDSKVFSLLGIFAKKCTIVKGE